MRQRPRYGRAFVWGALCVVAAPTSASCTLYGVADFELPTCASHDDCAALNAHHGLDPSSACELYLCASSTQRCALAPRDLDHDGDVAVSCGGGDCNDASPFVASTASEQCDGVDNDCDGLTDEGGGAELRRAPGTAAIGRVTDVAWTPSSSESAAAFFADGDVASLADLATGALHPARYRYQPTEDPLTMPMLADGCPRPGETGLRSIACQFTDVAIAEADEGALFAASISDLGCAAGQLRIGRIDSRADAAVVLRGPRVRSNLYLGVDVDWAQGACTAPTRTNPGAARVAAASLPRDAAHSPQALVAWLGDGLGRAGCGGAEVDVLALGVVSEQGASGGQAIAWVTGSNGGAPQVVGRTRGGGKPALAAWPSRGTFVAYGAASGRNQTEIRLVPRIADPPRVMAGAHPTDVRATEPLTIGAPLVTLDATSDAPPDHLALAVGPVTASRAEVAVAWIEGCGGAATRVVLQSIVVDEDRATSSAARTLSTTGGAAVSVAYQPSGLQTASGATDGWVVTWREASGEVAAQRFARDDLTPIEAAPSRLAARGSASSAVMAYRRGSDVRVSFVDGEQLSDAEFSCAEAAP